MKANIVDLRYKMKSILDALDRNETVTIMYHGKEKGTIVPSRSPFTMSISQHPFFGMTADDDSRSVEAAMEKIRGTRYEC
jgi:antitoxin (DNA-binding transcriptional repressor) of toxin-antitoxin stability system